MRQKSESGRDARVKQRGSTWKSLAIASAVIAMVQACLTIEGRGIIGFILWVIILFFAYWLFLTFLVWLWRRYRTRG